MSDYECPSCGSELERDEDQHGVVYQCRDLSCMEFFEEDEIVQGNEPERAPPMTKPLEDIFAYPPDDEVFDCWLWLRDGGYFSAFEDETPTPSDLISTVHLRFTNGVAEIVSQDRS